jgi:hypothetical protein
VLHQILGLQCVLGFLGLPWLQQLLVLREFHGFLMLLVVLGFHLFQPDLVVHLYRRLLGFQLLLVVHELRGYHAVLLDQFLLVLPSLQ